MSSFGFGLLDRFDFVPTAPQTRRGGPIVSTPPFNPNAPFPVPTFPGGFPIPGSIPEAIGGILGANPQILGRLFGQGNPARTVSNALPGSIVTQPAQPFTETASFPTGTYSQEPILPGSRGEVLTVVSPISGLASQVVRSPDPFGWNLPIGPAPFGSF